MKLIIKPHSGLANRIRAIVSAIGLSKKMNCDLHVVWVPDNGLGCKFNDLFEKCDYFQVGSFKLATSILDMFRARPAVRKYVQEILGFDFVMYDDNMREYVWSTGSDNIRMELFSGVKRNLYINTCHEFCFEHSNIDYLRPTSIIKSRVDANTHHFNRHTIGVHIRRGDHDKSITESPIEVFREYMRRELDHNPMVNFYIASDDSIIKIELQNEFGDIVHFSDFPLERHTKEGIQSALVELYSLSRTNKIIGSYWSSYSDLAARIGNIPLIVAQRKQGV